MSAKCGDELGPELIISASQVMSFASDQVDPVLETGVCPTVVANCTHADPRIVYKSVEILGAYHDGTAIPYNKE